MSLVRNRKQLSSFLLPVNTLRMLLSVNGLHTLLALLQFFPSRCCYIALTSCCILYSVTENYVKSFKCYLVGKSLHASCFFVQPRDHSGLAPLLANLAFGRMLEQQTQSAEQGLPSQHKAHKVQKVSESASIQCHHCVCTPKHRVNSKHNVYMWYNYIYPLYNIEAVLCSTDTC